MMSMKELDQEVRYYTKHKNFKALAKQLYGAGVHELTQEIIQAWYDVAGNDMLSQTYAANMIVAYRKFLAAKAAA